MSAATLVSAVSTADVAVEDRLAFWEHCNQQAVVGLTASTYEDAGLLARLVNLDLDGVGVADIAGNAHVVERPPRLVRDLPRDAAFLSVLLAGEAFFYHPGGVVPMHPGDVLVYDTDRPYLFGFGTSMRQVLLGVPRAVLDEVDCGPPPASPVKIAGDDVGAAGLSARALRLRLEQLVADPAGCPAGVRAELLELARTVVTGRPPAGAAEPGARRRVAERHIAEHLLDPRLCADDVARAVGVSTRHLNRAFDAVGTTVTQAIQHARLDRARHDLTAPSLAGVPIADISARWGFASQAHFSRLFRARFGCAPSAVRAAESTAASQVTGQ